MEERHVDFKKTYKLIVSNKEVRNQKNTNWYWVKKISLGL